MISEKVTKRDRFPSGKFPTPSYLFAILGWVEQVIPLKQAYPLERARHGWEILKLLGQLKLGANKSQKVEKCLWLLNMEIISKRAIAT